MGHDRQLGKLWLIGGTSESRELAMGLRDRSLPWLATVTTERARQLYALPDDSLGRSPDDQDTRSPTNPHPQPSHSQSMYTVRVGALTLEQAQSLVITEKIAGILDASHPFAVEISQMAIAIAQASNLPYLRFERSSSPIKNTVDFKPQQVFSKKQITDLLQPYFFKTYLKNQRILLTTGVKTLSIFQPYLAQAEFWARILPIETSRHQAIAAGFPENRLILQQLPVTFADELHLCKRLKIQTIITKSSGTRGGCNVKLQVAKQLNLRLILIERPQVSYPQLTDNLEEAIAWASRILMPIRSSC